MKLSGRTRNKSVIGSAKTAVDSRTFGDGFGTCVEGGWLSKHTCIRCPNSSSRTEPLCSNGGAWSWFCKHDDVGGELGATIAAGGLWGLWMSNAGLFGSGHNNQSEES